MALQHVLLRLRITRTNNGIAFPDVHAINGVNVLKRPSTPTDPISRKTIKTEIAAASRVVAKRRARVEHLRKKRMEEEEAASAAEVC